MLASVISPVFLKVHQFLCSSTAPVDLQLPIECGFARCLVIVSFRRLPLHKHLQRFRSAHHHRRRLLSARVIVPMSYSMPEERRQTRHTSERVVLLWSDGRILYLLRTERFSCALSIMCDEVEVTSRHGFDSARCVESQHVGRSLLMKHLLCTV